VLAISGMSAVVSHRNKVEIEFLMSSPGVWLDGPKFTKTIFKNAKTANT
jgi:Zn-finger nucleic acid-binding protein